MACYISSDVDTLQQHWGRAAISSLTLDDQLDPNGGIKLVTLFCKGKNYSLSAAFRIEIWVSPRASSLVNGLKPTSAVLLDL